MRDINECQTSKKIRENDHSQFHACRQISNIVSLFHVELNGIQSNLNDSNTDGSFTMAN